MHSSSPRSKSPERRALADAPQKLEAKIEVRTVEDVFAPAAAAR